MATSFDSLPDELQDREAHAAIVHVLQRSHEVNGERHDPAVGDDLMTIGLLVSRSAAFYLDWKRGSSEPVPGTSASSRRCWRALWSRSPARDGRLCPGVDWQARAVAGTFVREFTHSPVGPLPPIGNRVAFELMNSFRYHGAGRLAEEWSQTDNRSVLRQLGAEGP